MHPSFVLPEISHCYQEIKALRQHFHQHPELSFHEQATAGLVARLLRSWGYQVHEGIGKTGVVATLKKGKGPAIGLRAELDALPLQEISDKHYISINPGIMHACGHDGHITMLLAAARSLAHRRNFLGTLNLIFQPAEEAGGGAKAMIDDGLFINFPCDAIFAMHNLPGYPAGHPGFFKGPFMASADTAEITVHGCGGHAATPHLTVDPTVVCASIVMALQTIISRNTNPLNSAVVSVGSLHAGNVSNIIPNVAQMTLSIRTLNADIRKLIRERITSLIHAQADSFGASAALDYNYGYPVLINDHEMTEFAERTVVEWLGSNNIIHELTPVMASDDFAFMLEQCPGSYISIGNGDDPDGPALHHPKYDFNDECLGAGATLWIKLVEGFLNIKTYSER